MTVLKKTGVVLFLTVICLPVTVYGQFWNLGLRGVSDFSRQLDAMQWNMNGAYARDFSNFSIKLHNNFNSRLYLINGKAQNIQDENQAGLNLVNWFNPLIGFSAEAQSYTFSTNNISHNELLAGPSFRLNPEVTIRPLIGLMSDKRSGHVDQGPSVGLETDFKPMTVGEVSLNPDLKVHYANINPRKSHTYSIGTQALYDNNGIKMKANMHMGETRRDSYQPSSFLNRDVTDVVESIISDSTQLDINLNFPIVHNLTGQTTFYSLTNVRRFINNDLVQTTSNDLYDSRFVRQEMNLTFSANYQLGIGQLSSGFTYSLVNTDSRLINTDSLPAERVRRRQDILLNSAFNQHQFSLFTNNSIQIGHTNNLQTQGRISILHYDTPEMNFDDRDELSFLISLSDEQHFTNYLTGRITLAGEAFHNVFIFSQRSIENHWRRSIRLIPEFDWQPTSHIIIKQHFLIRANYTVYDFQLAGQPSNDQSSREYGFTTTADITLSPGWNLTLQGSRNELRIGRLYWKQFGEVPLDTLITYGSRFQLSHNINGIEISAGMRALLKYDHLQAAKIQITVPGNGVNQTISRLAPGRQITLQWGPTVEIKMPMSPRNELYIEGWLQKQNIRKRLYTSYPNIYADKFRNAEHKWDTRIFPNLTIHAKFYF